LVERAFGSYLYAEWSQNNFQEKKNKGKPPDNNSDVGALVSASGIACQMAKSSIVASDQFKFYVYSSFILRLVLTESWTAIS